MGRNLACTHMHRAGGLPPSLKREDVRHARQRSYHHSGKPSLWSTNYVTVIAWFKRIEEKRWSRLRSSRRLHLLNDFRQGVSQSRVMLKLFFCFSYIRAFWSLGLRTPLVTRKNVNKNVYILVITLLILKKGTCTTFDDRWFLMYFIVHFASGDFGNCCKLSIMMDASGRSRKPSP